MNLPRHLDVQRVYGIHMMTFRLFSDSLRSIPTATSWYLADLGEAIGKQQLFTRQSPQRLKALREHALIESAVSSNRIEGVEIAQKRIGTIIFGHPHLKDRDEEEVRGYRDALNLIHTKGAKLPVSEATIRQLHKLSRGQIWDAGLYKEKDGDIIEKYADGRQRVRFRPTSAKETPAAMRELIQLWSTIIKEPPGSADSGPCSVQPRFPLHSPVPRRQRPHFPPAAAAPKLPRWNGSGPLHQL